MEGENSDHRPIEGGFVKQPKLGLLEWLFSYDYNSLYPSIQVAFNLSPDTYIQEKDLPPEAVAFLRKINEKEGKFLEDLSLFDEAEAICKKYNIEFAGLGFFRINKQGILPKILEKYYYGRKEEKQRMLLSDAILSNSK
jgi:DNA polymerase elongation subunit (family B)